MLRLRTDTSTLVLVVEKQNAHGDFIRIVGFNHDGSQIVSGSDDRTIKVWNIRPVVESEWEEVDISDMPKDSYGDVKIKGLGYVKSNYWKNTVTGDLEKQNPSGSESTKDLNRDDQSLG